MKSNKYLPIWLAIVLLMIFYACRKNSAEGIQEQATIEKAIQYYNATNVIAKSGASETKESFKPDWNTAYVTQLADGSKSVIVTTADFKFEDDSKLSFLRFFAFKEQDDQIIFGRLIEAYGNKENMPIQKQQIISSFEQNQIKDFDGAILTYDVNYKYIGGRIFKSGTRVEGYARLGKQNKASKLQLPVSTDTVKSKNRIASVNTVLNEPGCQEWGRYLVLTYGDGHQEWILLYTWNVCEPGGGGGGNPPGGAGNEYVDASDPGTAYIIATFQDPIDLAQKLNCFNSLPNTGATYSVKICSDLPENSNPNALINNSLSPGHSFVTLTKTVGGVSVSESFGFYPESGKASVFFTDVSSMMVNDEGHEYNASMQVNVTESQFNAAIATAISESGMTYDLNGYNCTDFALAVFNSAVPPADNLVVGNWVPGTFNYGRTPNGLYVALNARSSTDSRASVSTANSPSSTNCP